MRLQLGLGAITQKRLTLVALPTPEVFSKEKLQSAAEGRSADNNSALVSGAVDVVRQGSLLKTNGNHAIVCLMLDSHCHESACIERF